jgi:hypothetical protein
MTRPNITPGDWTLEPAMDKQDCGLRIHTPESAAYGMAHIYSPGANAEANAVAMTAVPALLEALETARDLIKVARSRFPKSVKHPDTFKLCLADAVIGSALARAGYSFP